MTVWMEHEKTGGRAQLPDIEAWRARGWHPTDGPPPEPDPTQEPTTEAPPSAGLLAEQPKSIKTAKPAPSEEKK